MGKPISDDLRAAIIHDIRAGIQGCRAIAADHGVSHGLVSKIAKEEGLSFERREQTASATAAAQFDAKAYRQAAIERLYRDEALLAARMWVPYTQIVSSSMGAQFVTWKSPPIKELKDLVTARSAALERAARLEHRDSEDGSTAGRTMINDLFGAFQLAYHQIVKEDTTVDLTAPVDDYEPPVGVS